MARSRTPSPLSLIFLLLSIWSTLSVAKSAAEYYIQSLPGQPDGPLLRMHSGHIEVTPEHHGNLFFWNFENKHLANRHRTVLWLNGGPGCSSLDGALMEIGPYRLKDDAHLEYNPGSWDEFANLLFVDNPVGTGFSYVDGDSYLHELTEMSSQFITFLDRYFALFPDQESNDLYFAGESYAGQHIPYIAKAIMDRNKSPPNGRKWNLKGLLIGNGWIAPEEQYMSYIPQAYKDGLVTKGSDIAKDLEAQQSKCKAELDQDGADMKVNYPNCEKILHEILRRTSEERGNCVNMYDTRLSDEYPSCGMNWPPDLKFITPYLRRPDVIKALHIDPEKKTGWTECNGAVGGAFKARHSQPAVKLLPEILKEVPTLLFSGDQDLICSHIGTEAFIHNMEWNGGKGFELSPGTWAPRMDWTFEGEAAGYYQEARNLSYVLFYNASHMVPFDFPRRTRDMLDRFMGVDIANVGGEPADSRINGEKVPETSVGGHPNSTQAEQQVEEKIDKEKWAAYYRSGSIALVIIAILALAFGWYVWQDRRRRRGYRGLAGNESTRGLMSQSPMPGDLEASAFDIDNNELDSLRGVRPGEPRYSLGAESSDEEDEEYGRKGMNGHSKNEKA